MLSKKDVLIMLIFLSGCTNIKTENVDLALQTYAPGMVVVSEPVGKGFYAVVEEIDGKWQVVGDLSTSPIVRRANDRQEILFVNKGLRSVAPVFDRRLNTHGAHCTPIADKSEWYWLCSSQFSAIQVVETIGRNIVSCALTFCLAAGSRVELDHNKVQQAVIESGLIDIVKIKINDPVQQPTSFGELESERSLASSKRKYQKTDDWAEKQCQELHRILDKYGALKQ